jgi:hypothetical protein
LRDSLGLVCFLSARTFIDAQKQFFDLSHKSDVSHNALILFIIFTQREGFRSQSPSPATLQEAPNHQ